MSAQSGAVITVTSWSELQAELNKATSGQAIRLVVGLAALAAAVFVLWSGSCSQQPAAQGGQSQPTEENAQQAAGQDAPGSAPISLPEI